MAVATCVATALEKRRPLPVDRIIPDPLFTSTHAITIDAPSDQVWPWIAQMGAGHNAGGSGPAIVANRIRPNPSGACHAGGPFGE